VLSRISHAFCTSFPTDHGVEPMDLVENIEQMLADHFGHREFEEEEEL
jgi:hypothetical protein